MNFTRRHFFLGSLALPALAAKNALAAKKAVGEQPNILLILVDALPAWLLGCYGNTEVRTKNIDQLAQTGTRFLNHYSGSPMSEPARAVLLSGRTPMQLKGAGDVTLEKLLGGIGYACGNTTGGAAAVQFLDGQSAGKPFFLTANFAPFANLPEAGAYAQAKLDTFVQEAPAKNAARGKEMLGAQLAGNLRKVAAATTALDAEVGSLVARLIQKKLLGDTLIILTAPCGSLFGRHGLWASGDASDPVNFYEEVVAPPMIWSWSGHVPPLAASRGGQRVRSGAHDLRHHSRRTPAGLCGRSYLLLVTGKPLPKKQPWRTTVFAQYKDSAMARSDRYKVIVRDEGKGPGELYDDKVDPAEKVNQYDNPQFLTVKTSHSAELAKWKRAFSA